MDLSSLSPDILRILQSIPGLIGSAQAAPATQAAPQDDPTYRPDVTGGASSAPTPGMNDTTYGQMLGGLGAANASSGSADLSASANAPLPAPKPPALSLPAGTNPGVSVQVGLGPNAPTVQPTSIQPKIAPSQMTPSGSITAAAPSPPPENTGGALSAPTASASDAGDGGSIFSKFPHAMLAPPEVQRQVARTIATTSGVDHWTKYNSNLRNAVEAAGLPTSGPVSADQADKFLDLVVRYESGGRNIMQQVVGPQGGYNPSVGRITGPSTAQGFYQITDSTWKQFAGGKGGAAYPAMGNERGSPSQPDVAASSVPQALSGSSGTDGLYDASSGSSSPAGLSSSSPSGSLDLNQLKKLLAESQTHSNPSKILANMAAGFLGGRGPAQSLAGGFAGLAKAQQEDQQNNHNGLDLIKLLLSHNDQAQNLARNNFTALVNAGVPAATASKATGFNLPGAGAAGGADAANLTGDAFLKTLDPAQATQVKALAEGRMAFPPGFALSKPYWQNVIRQVAQYDPTFDAVNYSARSKTRNDFTSGKSAQNVTSYNTAIGHLGNLLQSAEALNNSNYPALNTLTNFYANNTGDPRVKAFTTARQAVADELTRAFRLSNGNVSDIKGWEANINEAGSPEQLKAVIKQAVDLLGSRIHATADQYTRGMGTTANPLDLLTDNAKKTLRALPGGEQLIQELGGGKVAGMTGQSLGGSTPGLSQSDQSLIQKYLK
jgi:hypothetical protein